MEQALLSRVSSGTVAEAARLAALHRYDILDTPPEPAFDRITRLVRAIFDVPMSTVTLIDAHRQFRKSRQGLDDDIAPREGALCYATISGAGPLIIPDAHEHPTFRENPFVSGAPHLRFYAGAPLVMPGGAIIGTLCAMDIKPHAFDERAVGILTDLAGIVVDEIARRPPPAVDATVCSLASPEIAAVTLVPATNPASEPAFRRVLKAGRISFNSGRSVMNCTIRGLSDAGALLDVVSTAGVPGSFKLGIPADDASRACRVVVKREQHLEVAFD